MSLVASIAAIVGCREAGVAPNTFVLAVPNGFPKPEIPADNPLTQAKVDLGKALFFDPVLSKDSTVSCASCHFEAHSFSDTVQYSKGVGDSLGLRNAMPLLNVAYATTLFWDGRSVSLEEQALAPILDVREMHSSPEDAIARIKNSPKYVAMFREAFGVASPDVLSMQRALASYERTLFTKANSPYDKYIAGDTNAMTAAAKRGLKLFLSEQGECFHCHSVGNRLFTTFGFENNALYEVYPDAGRYKVTGVERDKGKFKVPSLRNLAHTAPYMHDGSFQTLEQVVAHYATGGKNNPYKSAFLFNVSLSAAEQADIVAFLHALNDQ